MFVLLTSKEMMLPIYTPNQSIFKLKVHQGEPSSCPGDVISILDYQNYHGGFIAGANYERNIYCIQTNDSFLCRKTTYYIIWLNVLWEKNFK